MENEANQIQQPAPAVAPNSGGLFASLKNLQPPDTPADVPAPLPIGGGNPPAADTPANPAAPAGVPASPANPAAPTTSTVGNVQQAAAGAKLVTNTAFLIFPRICAAYSGEDSTRYDLRQKDKDDYEKVWYEFLLVSNVKISPAFTLIICTLTIFAGMFMNAIKDKKKNATLKTLRRSDTAAPPAPAPVQQLTPQQSVMAQVEHATAQRQYTAPQPTPAPAAAPAPAPVKNQPVNIMTDKGNGRRKFQIDANGLYKFDVAGNALAVANRTERPAADVFWMLSKGYNNKQILAEL